MSNLISTDSFLYSSRFMIKAFTPNYYLNYIRRSEKNLRLDKNTVHDIGKLPSTSLSPDTQTLLNDLLSWFQGDFDNYNQVLIEKKENDTAPHEHIHCILVPVTKKELINYLNTNLSSSPSSSSHFYENNHYLIAVYYLNGKPNIIFRSRLYKVFPEESKIEENLPLIRAMIYDLSSELRNILLENASKKNHDPLEWQNLFWKYIIHNSNCVENDIEFFTELTGCDVLWSTKPDAKRHTYLSQQSDNNYKRALHAIMEQEEVIKPSIMNPGTFIKVKDEISLWENKLWINDRGYDYPSGTLIYGNDFGIPYQLDRVASFATKKEIETLRIVTNSNLSWTLGDSSFHTKTIDNE